VSYLPCKPALVGLCLVVVLALTGGCGRAPASGPSVETSGAGGQWYQARLTTSDGAHVPFFLRLPSNCESEAATLVNGEERVPVDCQQAGGEVVLDFPVYGTRISATPTAAGTLEGSWVRPYMPEPQRRMAFSARPIAAPDPRQRFAGDLGAAGESEPSTDLSGVWRMSFGAHGPAKGMFRGAGTGVVEGTAELPSEYGDLRFLAGAQRGRSVSLSSFDGQHAYLLKMQVEPDGRLRGEFRCCDEVRDTFVAERSDDFQVVDPLQQVHLLSAERRVDIEALHDPKYDGKAVVVEIFGTWCPNCNDLAPLLTELYARYRNQGLEMLGLAYELSDDEAYIQARLAAYREKHGVTWDVVLAPAAPERLLARGPAQLSSIEGVPVTIFLNRDRTVHAIYSGFLGPAAGAAHEEASARIRALTREIVDSRF
jgi:thiol-disulfide isomerase/thioredoxin